MPMFEDNTGPAEDGAPFQKQRSPHQSPPAGRPNTPSKPIAIPAPISSPYNGRRMSEESISTELCEGPIFTGPSHLPPLSGTCPFQGTDELYISSGQPLPSTPLNSRDTAPIRDRAELIDRIKRGESPTWVPNRHLENIFQKQSSQSPTRSPQTPSSSTPTLTSLLPPADVTPERIPLEAQDQDAQFSARLEDGLNIERPRSALHSGDFTQTVPAIRQNQRGAAPRDIETPPTTELSGVATARPGVSGSDFHVDSSNPWMATSPPRHYTPFSRDHHGTPISSLAEMGAFRSSVPSPSSSISSSFVYKPPTSPLVQSQSNYDDDDDDDDFPLQPIVGTFGSHPTNAIDSMPSNSRRHTLTFSHLNYSQSSPFSSAHVAHSPSNRFLSATSRREGHHPYQAHQPRRSLSNAKSFGADRSMMALHAASTSQTPMLSRSRRPSFSVDASPLQHASMVGSYEESILRGRMSTTPSKPLDFLAQIGVLGLGAKCKPSLRCPAHVTLPFSAVFYSYSTTSHGRTEAEDGPSPYVGMLDLENGLPNSGADQRSKRKAMMPSRRTETSMGATVHLDATAPTNGLRKKATHGDDAVTEDMHVERLDISDTEPQKSSSGAVRPHKRRHNGPKAPPGGSYRIPQQGQLQIIIKNQNKTAVKLFLVPYDLSTMEPGTKTFIRQRSYSAGPVIDSVPALKDPSDRPILRYLIHLHICCPSRGRYYLYKSIRVVFANRVPDGKEKLRNELTLPEPRYSPYKPIRVMHPLVGVAGGSGYQANESGSGAAFDADKAFRRRSSGFTFAGQGLDADVPVVPLTPNPLPTWRKDQQRIGVPPRPGPASSDSDARSISADLTAFPVLDPEDDSKPGGPRADGSRSTAGDCNSAPTTPLYKKLIKGDVGYGGNVFVGGGGGPTTAFDGLLSQHLRSLEAEKPSTED